MMTELSWEEARDFVNQILVQKAGKHLSDLEILVFKGSWDDQTYDEMGDNLGYSPGFLSKDVGFKLWTKLTEIIEEKVSKSNFKEAIRRKLEEHKKQPNNIITPNFKTDLSTIVDYPEGSVSIDSPFYIERYLVESECYQEIVKPGALIRIKAPRLMGKTSLLNRISDYAQQQNYRTLYFDFKGLEQKKLSDLDKLLQWLCFMANKQLKLENKLKEYWDTEILGSNDNCTVYFEEYLLPAINSPLVLILDDVDRVFPFSEVIDDFFGMLRSWHEKGKFSAIWKQLKIVIAHSTEVYITLDLNQSPFNAGLPIELNDFDSKQIKHLANLHQLNWSDTETTKLMALINGHPYLVRFALYHLSKNKFNLDLFLKDATTESGIYSNHLRGLLQILKNATELAQSYQKVVTSNEPIELDSMQIYQLHSLGLVQRQDNHVIPRCNLYRQYFRRVLSIVN